MSGTGAGLRTDPWQRRVDSGDWAAITAELDEYGGALLPQLLTAERSGAAPRPVRRRHAASAARSTWARHRFGEGEYRYFAAPYPEPIERLKQALYPRLLPIARDWWARLGRPAPWPDTLDEWLRNVPRGRADQVDRHPAALPRRATGTPCTATSTATWCSRCRW